VAGGIPVVKALTEGLAANDVRRVMGVMNGTCNYILTRMESAGLSYDEVFAEAKALGYLEADPTLDVGGIDAAHKLALLAAIAFGAQVDFGAVEIEGIERITPRTSPAPPTWASASSSSASRRRPGAGSNAG
jgi:homoserine dehydrogenase